MISRDFSIFLRILRTENNMSKKGKNIYTSSSESSELSDELSSMSSSEEEEYSKTHRKVGKDKRVGKRKLSTSKDSKHKEKRKRHRSSSSSSSSELSSTPEIKVSSKKKKKGKKKKKKYYYSDSSSSDESESSDSESLSSDSSYERRLKKKKKKDKHKTKKHKKEKKKKAAKSGDGPVRLSQLSKKYYRNLEGLVNEKQKVREKGGNKNLVHQVTGASRRATYSKRSRTLILNAMKLEVQTHCRIALLIEPTWTCGKAFRYISGKKDIFRQKVSKSDTDYDPLVASTLETMKSYEEKVKDKVDDENVEGVENVEVVEPSCRICYGGREISSWVTCGYKGDEGCDYWVHQMCIGLKFTDEKRLKSVPYFCPTHVLQEC